MPDLVFHIESINAVDVASRAVVARLRIANAIQDEEIQAISLRCQVHINPARRTYSADEKAALSDLFGSPDRWPSTVRPLLWASTNVQVPGFKVAIIIDVPVPCSFDLNFAAAKFLESVHEGEIPTTFLFSGTVFYLGEAGTMQIAPIPWDREAAFRLPVRIWKNLLAELGAPASSVLGIGADGLFSSSKRKRAA